MSDPTTNNILLAVPGRGTDVGVWDTPLNSDMNILDGCAGSVTTKSIAGGGFSLTLDESRVSILRFTGILTGNVAITLGAAIKSWTCENNATGNGSFVIQMRGSTGAGNFVSLPPGSSQIYWDGTNLYFINLGRVGEFWDYSGPSVPLWVLTTTIPPYLICDGSTFNASTYPQLNEILGGNTLPDARGRSRFALNGGTGRLTTAGGIDGNTRFAGGGTGTGLTVAQANLPSVNFNLSLSDTRTWATTISMVQNGGVLNTTTFGSGWTLATSPVVVTGGSISGTAASGGSATALASVPPGYVGGITMIRAG